MLLIVAWWFEVDLEPPRMTRVVQKKLFFCTLLTYQLTAHDSIEIVGVDFEPPQLNSVNSPAGCS